MFSRARIHMRGQCRRLIFSFLIAVALGSAQSRMAYSFQSSPAAEISNSETIKKLKVASMQHDLILLLIENKSFDTIESEWKKVLDLKLGSKYEGAIAESVLAIAFKLSVVNQLPLAQRILDESLASVPFSSKDKSDIWRLKAYLYKEAGDLDSAIQAMKRASELVEK
jgi:tetratricopeptide (TPR) repeat protein